MNKEDILKILDGAKDKNGDVPMRLVRQAFEKLPESCTDTISRQAAIDAALSFIVEHCGAAFDEDMQMELKQRLEDLPSAQPEQRWIPCSERLPYTNDIYIVTRRISDGFEYLNITDACYFDGSNTWHDDTRVNHERKYLADVLAWMPLPESYRAERRIDNANVDA